ncbi:transposable element Tcb1 transposase [Trichonephila clavipes]|uniref:Transposable element Tcb1 transposase n=1 Tax=Trichonephila clavipes TaxID=2585209 RepID=A0A8X6WC33_TRICX|nr:transposable element Tcb1 transposase [Trichonephila clavipes]
MIGGNFIVVNDPHFYPPPSVKTTPPTVQTDFILIGRTRSRPASLTVWGALLYYWRSNLLRIEVNLNSNRYVREVLQPEVVRLLQGITGVILQQDNIRPHVVKTVPDFCSAQHMQFLPRPAYSPEMSPIEHVWDLDGRLLAPDPRPAASKTNFCCAYKQSNMEFSSTSRHSKSN